jgi:hypothetical protein
MPTMTVIRVLLDGNVVSLSMDDRLAWLGIDR